MGAGTEAVENRHLDEASGDADGSAADEGFAVRFRRGAYEKLARLRRRWQPVQFPLRLRVDQLYSKRLRRFTRQVYNDTATLTPLRQRTPSQRKLMETED